MVGLWITLFNRGPQSSSPIISQSTFNHLQNSFDNDNFEIIQFEAQSNKHLNLTFYRKSPSVGCFFEEETLGKNSLSVL